MTRDAHGLEIPPRTRWKQLYEALLNESLRIRRDLEQAREELQQANARITLMTTQMQMLRNQNKALRAGQAPLPLEEVA
ncbi:hypothetical protein [uncultured Pseudodesulfovibrio sp.]|uniref:hypothetical protein n=1 Tax=uncultured Pseudodesulfovibrio sp. TaxID=2035858 RepID=UPI0029C8A61B|nr:hypothetical protein [uncultured Pseudodesulfovibrio sp.]